MVRAARERRIIEGVRGGEGMQGARASEWALHGQLLSQANNPPADALTCRRLPHLARVPVDHHRTAIYNAHIKEGCIDGRHGCCHSRMKR